VFWAYEAGGRFTYRHGGRDHKIPAAVGVHHEALLQILDSPSTFATWAKVDPDVPAVVVDQLLEAYCTHQGLPANPDDATYLVALLSVYGDELEVDLRKVGVDLRTEFQARHWRLLLNAISRLPYATHWRQTMLNDPETAERIVRAQERQKEKPKSGIPIAEFTQDVALLRDAITTLRGVQAAIAAAAGGRPGAIEPYPGPITVLGSVERDVRQRDHEALVARVLPGRGSQPDG